MRQRLRDSIALAMSTVLAAGFIATSAGVAQVNAGTIGLRVCAANIQHTPDLPAWQVRADAREAREHCDVVLFQEIRERADHRALEAEGWHTTRYTRGGVPVAWRTSRVASAGAADTVRVSSPTPACADGSPSYNPARFITLKPLRVRATGQGFTAISLHFPQRRTTCHQATTTHRWREAYANTRSQLPAGPVVIGGDWNRREPEIEPMTRWHWVTAAPKSLDHTAVARTSWIVERKFTRPLHSDHALTGAVLIYRR